MTHIIELFGGPGTGKSTVAALIFHKLKRWGYNAELVQEYAKEWAWEGRTIGVYDQLHIAAEQVRREACLLSKVDFIVTDSPVALGHFYTKRYGTLETATAVKGFVRGYEAQARADKHVRSRWMLSRVKEWNPNGRYQTREEAEEIDLELNALVTHLADIEPSEQSGIVEGNETGAIAILRVALGRAPNKA